MVVVVTQQTKFRWSNTFQVKCNDGQNEDDDNQVVELEQRKDANLSELEALRHQVHLLSSGTNVPCANRKIR